LDEVISSIQASSQTQDRKIDSLEKFCSESEKFISEVIRIDEEVAELINKRKENFYKEYYYLKPESEKSGWEKIKDGLKAVAEWCKENWKSIAKIVVAAVVIAGLGIAAALTGGILGVVLAGAFWGALAGGLIGGAVGGIAAAINGGSFLEGFAGGALSGAISGAVTGAACAGLGALGAAAGKGIQCMSTVGKAINVTSKVTAALSFGMDGFDMLAMGVSLFDPSNALVEFNQKLHSNALYNGFQIAVNALAVFSAGAASTMKCFVAGTLILTVAGLVAIENIKAGDKVIATNPETFEVAEKTVLETYVRETTELLHLTINGEVIKTTFEHPFYVKDVGFVEAGKLQVGDKLVDSRGNVLVVEGKKLEITDKPVKVYNFKVDNFHTYHVGENRVLVHNANKYVKGTSSTGQNINRALTASDLGIDASKITKLEGSFKIVDGKAVVSIDMIEGKLGFVNPTKVIDNLVNVAKGQGATSIRIQGTIANEQLLNVLTKRYNFVTSGGSGGYTEYLEIMLK